MKNRKFRITKWIMFSLAVLSNAFLIFYSCISDEQTKSWNWKFTNFFVNLVNGFTTKEESKIGLENIDIAMSKTYEYNNIPGYEMNQIPLGSVKKMDCTFYPLDATDKSIEYHASPSNMVELNQDGSILSLTGMKPGECVITAKSNDGGHESSFTVEVVETLPPVSFEVSLDKTDIAIGTTQTINFDIDGGVLTHDELINFRYYDIRKLDFSSSDESIADVDDNGVIYPKAVGSTNITVRNGDFKRTLNINITAGTPPTPYSNLSINGSNVCYANDMVLDQSSKTDHYQLVPMDGSVALDPNDFIWESNNELLVKIDRHGVMRGFRKSSIDDEEAVIKATSKLTGQVATYNVTVKNQLPSEMFYWFDVNGKEVWNPYEYTLTIGDNIMIKIGYKPYNQNRNVIVVSSNPNVVSFTNEGVDIVLHALTEGSTTIKLTSVIKPELSISATFTVVKAGAIALEDVEGIGKTIRKSIGHACAFLVAQVFTYLTFFMFFYERKWYVYSSMSLGEGLFISILSEFIQFLVPTRSGTIIDVLINFSGVVVGAGLTFLGIFLVKKIKERTDNKANANGEDMPKEGGSK